MSLHVLRLQNKPFSQHSLFPSELSTLLVATKTHISLYKMPNAGLLEKAFHRTSVSLRGPNCWFNWETCGLLKNSFSNSSLTDEPIFSPVFTNCQSCPHPIKAGGQIEGTYILLEPINHRFTQEPSDMGPL